MRHHSRCSSGGGSSGEMPCESCAVQFSVFRRRRACPDCERAFCAGCLRRGAGLCGACRALSTRPLLRHTILHLKPRELQAFLQRQNVSTRGCVEKEDLLTLCLNHVNSGSYRRQGPRSSNTFNTLKGFKDNINQFINSAFELNPAQPARAPPPRQEQTHREQPNRPNGCYNSSHVHAEAAAAAAARERVSPTAPRPQPPSPTAPSTSNAGMHGSESARSLLVETADCLEIEDVDDAGWEFVYPPADPLPNDSEVLLQSPERPSSLLLGGAGAGAGAGTGSPRRAASQLELRSPGAESPTRADTASLQDEPYQNQPEPEPEPEPEPHSQPPPSNSHDASGYRVVLSEIADEAALARLSVLQLKFLLGSNGVCVRGLLERRELLARAAQLLAERERARRVLDALPLDELCKICMAAPLECVLLECGHMAACAACARRLPECPICRQYVVRAVRVFRS